MTKSIMQALLTQEEVHDIHQNTKHYKKGNATEHCKQNKFTLWTDQNTVQHPKPPNYFTDVPL